MGHPGHSCNRMSHGGEGRAGQDLALHGAPAPKRICKGARGWGWEWGCIWGGAQRPAEHKLLQGGMVGLANSALMPELPGTGG